MGAASRKEKRAACSRSSPTPRPAAIVAPDREMPGMMAIPWAMPTRMAEPQLSFSASCTRLALSASAAVSAAEVMRNAKPTQISAALSNQSLPASPMRPVGIVATTMSHASRLSCAFSGSEEKTAVIIAQNSARK